MNPKQRAAEAALPFLKDGMVIGLGTGTTADFFLQALAAALASGKLRNIVGVPTSRQSEHRALELGIPLTTFTRSRVLDLTVDGADEIDPNLDLIKAGRGAARYEKKLSLRIPSSSSSSLIPAKWFPCLEPNLRYRWKCCRSGRRRRKRFFDHWAPSRRCVKPVE